MGATHSKKVFKAALKKRRMEKLPKGQRSSSGVSKQRSGGRSPSITEGGSPFLSSSPATPTSKTRKSLKTTINSTSTKKTVQTPKDKLTNNNNSPATPQICTKKLPSTNNFQDRVLQKTSTVSPAPAVHLRNGRSSSKLTRFGFKSQSPKASRPSSGESTDSVNSILSDAHTFTSNSDSFLNLDEDNGNHVCQLVGESKSRLNNAERQSSPCTISQASSGVTSAANSKGRLTTQAKHLPEPQIISVKTVASKNSIISNTRFNSLPSPSNSLLRKKNLYLSLDNNSQNRVKTSPLVMPKFSAFKIPQTKSSLLKAQKTNKDSEAHKKSFNTLDSGLGSSSESDRIRESESLKGSLNPKSKNFSKGKLELDISDAWLKDKRKHPSPEDTKLKRNSYGDGGSDKSSSHKDQYKDKRDTNITYGMARQKFAPYNRNRSIYHSPAKTTRIASTTPNINNSKTTPASAYPSRFGFTGSVRSKIEKLEKTPSVTTAVPFNKNIEINSSTVVKQEQSNLIPRKPPARPTNLERTPHIVSPSTPENTTVELSRTVCRRLEYSEGSKLNTPLHSNQTSPTAQDILIVASYELKRQSSKDENEEQKLIKDLSESEKTKDGSQKDSDSDSTLEVILTIKNGSTNSQNSPTDSESSIEVLDTPEEMKRESIPHCIKNSHSPQNDYSDTKKDENISTILLKDESKKDDTAKLKEHTTDVPSLNPSTKHTQQESPSRKTQLKKCKSKEREVPPKTLKLNSSSSDDKEVVENEICDIVPPLSLSSTPGLFSALMNSSRTSENGDFSQHSRMTDSCERSTNCSTGGKCTPTGMSSYRSDMDQDFLIDDEISDQPGLTFGDDLVNALFEDEDLFADDLPPESPPPFHYEDDQEDDLEDSAMEISNKTCAARSRHESFGTVSSIGGDDLMLDFDGSDDAKNSSLGYEEEIQSPTAKEIYSEWATMLAQVKDSNTSTEPLCVSNDSIRIAPISSSYPSDSAPIINTQQPQSNGGLDVRLLNLQHHHRQRPSSVELNYHSPLNAEGKRVPPVLFKPPRQGIEQDGLSVDRTNFHYICQDVTAMKTLLFKLRRVLQAADTVNPFETNLITSFNVGDEISSSKDESCPPVADVAQENLDLKRQVVLLQQSMHEKDRTINVLQQQLMSASYPPITSNAATMAISNTRNTMSASAPSDSNTSNISPRKMWNSQLNSSIDSTSSTKSVNAATQTERTSQRTSALGITSMSRTSSVEDGLGPTVSFRLGKVHLF